MQGDPFASPSRFRVRVSNELAGFPKDAYSNKSREIALRDFLTRRFFEAIKIYCKCNRGSGKSGIISIDRPGQEILERTSVFIKKDYIEARFLVGLPSFGRTIAARHAEAMLFEEVPKIVEKSIFYRNLNRDTLYKHIKTSEDADFLRNHLDSLGLAAFIADGAILPRRSGIDPRPLNQEIIVPFESPGSLRVKITLPNRGEVTGMGIPLGITLIIGGGYHGKSTLLKAIELGIYNHIPGDGREFVISNHNTVKIRAEDGRRIEKVNISPFINNLPFGKDTKKFSTDDASGSTSQSANIIEALEVDAKVLLIDEDTSATNFMIRDKRMQEMVQKSDEPITPFMDKVLQIKNDLGVSTILVMGGSGDYLDIADHIICMVEYKPYDLTKKAHEIAKNYETRRKCEGGERFGELTERIPIAQSFDPSKGKREVKISPKGLYSVAFGTHKIDLGALEQLVDISQTRAIGDAIYYAKRYMDGKRTLREIVDSVLEDIDKKGLDVLNRNPVGDYAYFRRVELIFAINRLRTLSVKQKV